MKFIDKNVFENIEKFLIYLADVEIVLKQDNIKFVGWEKNYKGMFCPKFVDLSKTMDSKKWANLFKNTFDAMFKIIQIIIIIFF